MSSSRSALQRDETIEPVVITADSHEVSTEHGYTWRETIAPRIGTFRSRSGAFIKSGEATGIAYLVPVDKDGRFEPNKFITEMPAFSATPSLH